MRVSRGVGLAVLVAVTWFVAVPVLAGNMNMPGDLEKHPAEQAVQKLLAKNRGPDYSEKETFSPERPITRGELATLLCRVLPTETTSNQGYTEENSAHRFYRDQVPANLADKGFQKSFGYVETIVRRGYMEAEDGKFRPNDPVLGGEFLQIMLKVLQNVREPYLTMPDVADSAESLNRHLTRYQDVSLPAYSHPGWIRIAENYNVLPAFPGEKGGESFDPRKPVSRALVCAIISNLFIKWDACYYEVPFGQELGNRSLDKMFRRIDGSTVTEAELVEVAPGRKTFSVRYKKRKMVKLTNKILRTVYMDSTEILTLGDGALVRVFDGDTHKCFTYPQAVSELESYVKNKRNRRLYKLGVNFLTLPSPFRYKEDEYTGIFNEVGEQIKVRQVEYLELHLIPYDIKGRIVCKKDNGMKVKDLEHGIVQVEFHPRSAVKRIVITDPMDRIPDAVDSFVKPENGVIYANPWDAFKLGETVYVKLERGEGLKVKEATSWLRRIGVPSNVDLVERKLRTQYYLDKFYQCDGHDWEKVTGKGLILWRFTGDPNMNYWQSGGIGNLFESWSRLREVDLYVQPDDTFLGNQRVEVPVEQRILFIEAVQH